MKKISTYLKYSIHLVGVALVFGIFAHTGWAQTCSLPTNGQNLIPNGNFSLGNSGFATDYVNHATAADVLGNCAACYRNWSMPDEYMVGSVTSDFHFQFLPVTDVTPTADNNFLMVDGSCTDGKDAWRSTVTVVAGVTYYFEAYITTLASSASQPNVATLRLLINGSQVGTDLVASATTGSWTKLTVSYTASANATIPIVIDNKANPSTCGSGNDYGIDEISFTPGCQQGSTGPKPNLGNDRTICGTGGTINLAANAPGATRYLWSGPAPVGGATTSSVNITGPGTYSVCVDNGVSCPQADQIVISNTYSFDLGGPFNLCNPVSQILDAQHTGVNVTYQWYKESNGTAGWQLGDTIPNSKSRTYTATAPGTYRVVVTDPSCLPAKEDVAIITSDAATPVDAYFCPPNKTVNLSVTGSGNYNWYAAATGGSVLAGGANTNSYTTPPISATTTYYVEDVKVYNTSVGAPTLNAAARNQTQINDKYMVFEAKQPLTIDSVTVYFWLNNNNANDPISIQFRLFDNPANYNTTPATLSNGVAFSSTNTLANGLGLISPPWPTKADGIYAVRVPVKINVPAAGEYRLGVAAQNPTNTQIQTSGGAYPYNDVATAGDVIVINQSKLGNNPPTATEYHGMFNWKINYNNACARIPVKAIAYCTLPVEYLDFSVVAYTEYIALRWATAWEENNDYFIIERSNDGIHFEKIGKKEGRGNSSVNSTYSFNDPSAPMGIVYYRLAQYDENGAVSYSVIRTASNEKNSNVFISPNPSKGSFTIAFQTDAQSELSLKLLNLTGQTLYSETTGSGSGNFSKELNMPFLPSGIYYLHIQGSNHNSIDKIVIE